MFCTNCGHELDDDSLFCSECGARVRESNFLNVNREKTFTNDQVFFVDKGLTNNLENNAKKASLAICSTLKDGKEVIKNKLQLNDDETNVVYSNIPSVDLIMRVSRSGNRRILLWIFINLIIYYLFINSMITSGGTYSGIYATFLSFFIAVASYSVCIAIALSPVGEFILRTMNSCKRIKRKEYLERLEPLFEEVYGKARIIDPNINQNIELFMSNDPSANAFATGRKTICVTKGLLELTDDEIKGTLSHEFGHISHRDTDILLVVIVGNLFIAIISWILSVVLAISKFASDGDDEFAFGAAIILIITSVFNYIVWVWTNIGMMIVRSSMRKHEFEADKFALDLGYGNELCYTLDNIASYSENAQGLFATLASTHPNTEDRISRMQDYGCSYRKY